MSDTVPWPSGERNIGVGAPLLGAEAKLKIMFLSKNQPFINKIQKPYYCELPLFFVHTARCAAKRKHDKIIREVKQSRAKMTKPQNTVHKMQNKRRKRLNGLKQDGS